jgi:hypothetical protein
MAIDYATSSLVKPNLLEHSIIVFLEPGGTAVSTVNLLKQNRRSHRGLQRGREEKKSAL